MTDDVDLASVDLVELRSVAAEIEKLAIDVEISPRLFEVLQERFGDHVVVADLLDDAEYERRLSPGSRLGGHFDWRVLVDEIRGIFAQTPASSTVYGIASIALLAVIVREMELDLASTGIALALYLALRPKTPMPAPHAGGGPRLDLRDLHELHSAAVSGGLTNNRTALFTGVNAGFVATIPEVNAPSAQILVDLDAMNAAGRLTDGSTPITAWLRNAIVLLGGRGETKVFDVALLRCEGRMLTPDQ